MRGPVRARLIALRIADRRRISASLSQCVEHRKSRQACLDSSQPAGPDRFSARDRWRVRRVDKVHVQAPVHRCRWRRSACVFDAEDLEPLRRDGSGLCGTDVALPLRVRQNRSAQARDPVDVPPGTAAEVAPDASDQPGRGWSAAWLRPLQAARTAPSQASFHNPDPAEQARRIDRADVRLPEQARRRGLLDGALTRPEAPEPGAGAAPNASITLP